MSESDSFDLSPVDRLTVGTVGPPGQRMFLLQARRGARTVTLKLEKQQVAAISDYLQDMLAGLSSVGPLPTDLELEDPNEPEWTIGTIGVAYDDVADRIVLVVEELVAEDETGARARIVATREQVAALATRGAELLGAGRPLCPLCGNPLDPRGHVCPRNNGNRAPLP